MSRETPETTQYIKLRRKLEQLEKDQDNGLDTEDEIYSTQEDMEQIWPCVNQEYIRQLDEEGLL